ncbi:MULTISPECIES: endolytic transglycosylase MltG [unclassified Sedimentibacter]|uniref:endolytic transglycosylase MltG n=1 Tax=unclassified Sedimentibacter TaxID=2649220 RepID=UPI0027DFFA94|nr:endolytic transglycosylase MltG [Sedimentibacter sp. MB35-C1]WMJ75849.1 endolytic transglycosylase MltG [Sedimentibacter sp. MB35-C1]
MKKLIAVAVVLILAVFAYFFVSSYIDENLKATDTNDDTKLVVEIPSGSTTNDIADILYENNLIKNKLAFKFYAEKTGKDSSLKAGSYVLSKNMNVEELIQELTKGGSSGNTLDITLIEGLTIEETAESISEQLELNYDKLLEMMNNPQLFREDFAFLGDNPDIESLQGYLMPDTYNVYINSSEEDIIKILLSQFDEFYEGEIVPRMEDSELSFSEVIDLASIVEKEALLDEERDEVAAVFLNRLDINMKLQSCATVNYAHGEWKERLTYEDIAIDSPFNTYVIEGLPPAPINSPGKASIIAVLEPADVDYLYFVAKGDGSHYFSRTYDEHIDAANEYLD